MYDDVQPQRKTSFYDFLINKLPCAFVLDPLRTGTQKKRIRQVREHHTRYQKISQLPSVSFQHCMLHIQIYSLWLHFSKIYLTSQLSTMQWWYPLFQWTIDNKHTICLFRFRTQRCITIIHSQISWFPHRKMCINFTSQVWVA